MSITLNCVSYQSFPALVEALSRSVVLRNTRGALFCLIFFVTLILPGGRADRLFFVEEGRSGSLLPSIKPGLTLIVKGIVTFLTCSHVSLLRSRVISGKHGVFGHCLLSKADHVDTPQRRGSFTGLAKSLLRSSCLGDRCLACQRPPFGTKQVLVWIDGDVGLCGRE